ncbi:trimeric intracellular cation channel family protein [Bifidobacterium ramosum]|nr:trimeric intracellular cation channel family protein [Bifidobacterium ramosum]
MGIEYLAIFCSGLMGGLCAVKKNYDLFAMMITAWLTALGGGIIRDVMLGSLPPVGISDKGFVFTALVSGLAVAVFHPEVDKLKWSMLTLDALSVGLFAVNGTSKAMLMGTSGMTAAFMGMFTALGGGLVRDMLLNDIPLVIRDKHWYAVPSAVGCILTVLVMKGAQAGIVDFTGEVILDSAIVVLVVALRLLSVKFDITFPGAMKRSEAFLPSQSRYLPRPVIHPHAGERDVDREEQDGRR